MIEKFATGSLASFGRETNVDLSNKYIVLDMTEMTDLSAVAMYDDMIAVLESRAGEFYLEEAMLLYGNGNMETALPLFEQAYNYTPDSPEVIYHLARIYHEQGDLFQAKALYEIILEEHQYSTRYQEAETYLGYVVEALKKATPTPAP